MDHLPPAPTPPVNNGSSRNMASASDRTSNLLNLLKFSGGGSQQQQRQTALPPQQAEDHQPEHQLSPQQEEPQQLVSPPQTHHQEYHQEYHQHRPSISQEQYAAPIHQPAPAAADPSGLLAALMRGSHDSASPAPRQPENGMPEHQQAQQVLPQQAPQQNPFGNGSPPPDTRSYLLNLLNRPKPGQNDPQPPLLAETSTSRSNNDTPHSTEQSDRARELMAQFQQQPTDAYTAAKQYQARMYGDAPPPSSGGGAYSAYSSAQQQPSTAQADGTALYQQLMGNLSHQQSSPQSGSAQILGLLRKDHSSPAGSQRQGSLQGSQRGDSVHSPLASPHDLRQNSVGNAPSLHSHHSVSKPTPTTSVDYESYPTPEARQQTAPETAPGPVPEPAGEDEHEKTQAEIARELDQMLNADSENEFNRSARAASKNIKKELDGDETEDALDQTLPADVADTVRDMVDEAAGLGVADSWESADQDDEIVVIEEDEEPPVKVFNFPMKPWISITLQEDGMGPRPEFRDEAIMDIARLKKEFDQIDRNLYTASPNYMTYGMSKQGGLRVIRQDDGKDAKAFTDTKDRIFNVAMSVSPPDHDGPYREAIIGTGISGTVYWLQIRDGDKDHIEDAHLEQYGFALPPMSSGEGDTPGGVLKTRARASTGHPEFFAVGRGKVINIVWPSYIMQGNLLKPGHDRLVDTDRFSQQCSLKINTGKAGKDFTFSQDDTVVVSLDKSGRVKFWDVQDLTAAKEGSDPRNPTPAHSSLEIKEPLMTLGSTPEGEKAWPTSVMLLDKQRPYQKRCALRYMIVGMKQNHTLQLWDLALGKPVQEFNLPHSKESDAVCSVMYHAASGMIVIGHPTRNSIYFAHLSAPKYNLKGVSQAEYIQRLVAQDSSIPQPDSTAVISGVREYSFANRGILRSLDILSNPAMVQDTDEPTLFELYAMHSKGVACLLIKQRELGWSNDNKVLAPVDAVSENLVTVSKIKPPQAPETSATAESSQIRGSSTNHRTLLSKESQLAAIESSMPATYSGNGESNSKAPEPSTASRNKGDDAAQSSRESAPEKPERKPRKKRGAAGGNQADAATNGTAANASSSRADKTASGPAISSDVLDAAVSGMETRLGTSLADTFKSSLKNLHGKIDDGARAREDSFNQHQLKLLDMVSTVLNENTQKVLEAMVHKQFTDLVIPAIGEKASKAVSDVVSSKLQPQVSSSVQKEIQGTLPQALNRSLRSADYVKTISESISSKVTATIEQDIASSLSQRLAPAMTNAAAHAAREFAHEMGQQYHEQFERLNAQRVADSNKIDQLQTCVQQLTGMISTMAASQSSLHAEVVKLRQSPVHELPGPPQQQQHGLPRGGPMGSQQMYGPGAPTAVNQAAPSQQGNHLSGYASSHAPSQSQTYMGSPQYGRGPAHQQVTSPPESGVPSEHAGPANHSYAGTSGAFATQNMARADAETDEDLVQRMRIIEQMIQEGHLQEAMIQWIQSGREEAIFRGCLARYPPSKFEGLPPLLLLVVIATIAKNLRPNPRLKEEIEWIEMAVRTFGAGMPNYEWEKHGQREVARSTSQTMSMLVGRLRALASGIQDGFPTDPFLANVDGNKLEWIARTAENIVASFGAADNL